jgi:hypothetical protein
VLLLLLLLPEMAKTLRRRRNGTRDTALLAHELLLGWGKGTRRPLRSLGLPILPIHDAVGRMMSEDQGCEDYKTRIRTV